MDVIRKTVETQYMLSTAFEIVSKPDDVSEIMLALLRSFPVVDPHLVRLRAIARSPGFQLQLPPRLQFQFLL